MTKSGITDITLKEFGAVPRAQLSWTWSSGEAAPALQSPTPFCV